RPAAARQGRLDLVRLDRRAACPTWPDILHSVGHPSIAISGAGRLGTAVASSLKGAGYAIAEIITRRKRTSLGAARILAKKVGARSVQSESASLGVDLVWFCVPDSKITDAARELSDRDWKSRVAIHSSGVLT